MRNKLFLHSLLFILFLFVGVKGSTQAMSIMPPDADPSSVFGEDHYYSVIFRGNGDAVVNLKAIFTNTEEATVSAVTLHVPNGTVEDIVAYQIIKERRCLQYEQKKLSLGATPENDYQQLNCLQYENPDYYGYYYSNNTKYKKAVVKTEGDSIVIALPEAVPPEVSASYILYYRSKAYTQKDFAGAYSYIFETLKTESPLRNVQIGISTDSNLRLKNATADVNYAGENSMVSELKTAPSLNSAGMTNQAFDRYYQQIGQGTLIENASSLQPFDTFIVEGAYAKSNWQLHAKAIIIGLVIMIVGFTASGFGIVKLIKYLRKKPSDKGLSAAHGGFHSIFWLIGGSFGSSILTAAYTLFLFVVMNFVNGYYYMGYQYNMLIVLFMLILSLGVYPLCLFVPSIVMGMKRGLWWGIGTFAMTIAWLMMFLFVIFGFLLVTRVNNEYPQPLPYVYGTSDRMAPEAVETK